MRPQTPEEELESEREAAEIEAAVTPEMRARYQRGKTLIIIGLAGLLPSLLVTILSTEYRFAGAIASLCFWIVTKIGKTIMKLNSATA